MWISVVALLAACDSDDGDDGQSSLVVQSTIPILSTQCPFGGVRTLVGFDTDGDGTLSGTEIDSDSSSCNPASTGTLDQALRGIIAQVGITADPARDRLLPSVDDPIAQLGKKLFFSKALGGDQDAACVTCHHPFLGGGDDLSLPIGVAAEVHDLLGPGRAHSPVGEGFDGGPTVPRNAPTTYNIGLWDQVIFHDGRIESLTKIAGSNGGDQQIRTPEVAMDTPDPSFPPNLAAAQALFPVTSAEEMRGFDFEAGNSNGDVRSHLAARLQDAMVPAELVTNAWLEEFRLAFATPAGTPEDLITYNNVALALAEYERSQVFVDNAFKAYVDGDDTALSGDAKLGAILFYSTAGCAGCHSGDFMTDESFHVVGMPQIGRGKGDGITLDDDFGRFRETGVEADRYAFRTPSLLNVATTGPFSHAGAYKNLADVVRHHANPRAAVENYDFTQLDAGVQVDNMLTNTALALDQIDALRVQGLSQLPELTLSDADISRLVAFLEALTDPCLTDLQCIGRWVPNVSDSDPDGLRVQAIDQFGQPLSP